MIDKQTTHLKSHKIAPL